MNTPPAHNENPDPDPAGGVTGCRGHVRRPHRGGQVRLRRYRHGRSRAGAAPAYDGPRPTYEEVFEVLDTCYGLLDSCEELLDSPEVTAATRPARSLLYAFLAVFVLAVIVGGVVGGVVSASTRQGTSANRSVASGPLNQPSPTAVTESPVELVFTGTRATGGTKLAVNVTADCPSATVTVTAGNSFRSSGKVTLPGGHGSYVTTIRLPQGTYPMTVTTSTCLWTSLAEHGTLHL